MTDKADVVSLRRSQIDEPQAADWLAKLDRGDLTKSERDAFARWLAAHPNNRQAIREVADMWYGLNAPLSKYGLAVRSSEDVGPLPVFRPALFAGLFSRLRFAAAAGAFALVIFAAGLYFFSIQPAPAIGYYATKIGETRVVSLNDGSKINLNTNSSLEQDYSRGARVVRLLSGEAIFDVAHDERRPFIVYAADGVIRAVGTRFAVRVEPEKLSIAVTEGKIALQRRFESNQTRHTDKTAENDALSAVVFVEKGEAAEIDRGATIKEAVSDQDLDERLSWAEGRLVFHDKELQEVVNEVARYTDVDIVIADETLKRRKISGILDIGEVTRMIEGMEGALGVKADWASPNLVYLTAG